MAKFTRSSIKADRANGGYYVHGTDPLIRIYPPTAPGSNGTWNVLRGGALVKRLPPGEGGPAYDAALELANQQSTIKNAGVDYPQKLRSAEESLRNARARMKAARTDAEMVKAMNDISYWETQVKKLGEFMAHNGASPFTNGRARAEAYLNQRMKDAGVRVENDGSTSARDYKVGDELRLRGRYGVIKKMNASQVTLDIDGEFYTASWNDPQLKR